jgi:hypothetical protein
MPLAKNVLNLRQTTDRASAYFVRRSIASGEFEVVAPTASFRTTDYDP